MSYKLNKPYTDKQRADFIVLHNHQNGRKIEETSIALYALEPFEKLEGDEVVDNTEAYEAEQAAFERQRINNLTLTRRVFALALQQVGVSYTQLKELIATNEQAQLEWELCSVLQRSNPLLDIMAAKIGITAEELDNIFITCNQAEQVTNI